jgi:hypothetical protein
MKIKLGYEINTGKPISIPLSHMLVTGVTQLAGKTTTLESLIKRSGKKAVVFRTKIGEKSFLDSTIIPPYFKDRSDWQFVKGLIESTMKTKIRSFEQAKIIQICKRTSSASLVEFKKAVDERMLDKKINSFEYDILTNLQAYLEIVLPKLQTISFSEKLDLSDGLNVIDLERFSRDSEVQSLVIMSVLEEILYNYKDVIVVIPEAWKFIPQDRGNPCKLIVEEFIRQGAANKNYIWIDSQDMSGVDKTPLKQISEWVLGYQTEKNEVKHTLDQLPIPKTTKPKPDEIMSLGKGIFYYASRDLTTKVYVQPFWLDDERSVKIAQGDLKVTEIDGPPVPNIEMKIKTEPEKIEEEPDTSAKHFENQLTEIRSDVYTKIISLQSQLGTYVNEMHKLKNSQVPIDENAIIAKVLEKIPIVPNHNESSGAIDKDAIISEIMAKIPAQGKVYQVSPLEKITNDFLLETKNKILNDIQTLPEDAKRILKYLESRNKEIKTNEIITQCFFMAVNKTQYNKIGQLMTQLKSIGVARKGSHGGHLPNLMTCIHSNLDLHQATEQEMQLLYDHILMELLPETTDNQ